MFCVCQFSLQLHVSTLFPWLCCCAYELDPLTSAGSVFGKSALLTAANFCSLEEFTGLMKGQIATRNMEDEIRDTFAVFEADNIDIHLLKLMVQVSKLFFYFR
jgi:hypothetical protein